MQVRRAVLAFAIALMLAAVVSSLAPPPATRNRAPATPPAPAPAPPADARSDGTVELDVESDRRRPLVRRVERGSRAVLTVEVAEPGDVSIPALGRYAAADSTDPAVFDLLLDRPGRFPVVFTPADGDRRVVARLVVREPPPPGPSATPR